MEFPNFGHLYHSNPTWFLKDNGKVGVRKLYCCERCFTDAYFTRTDYNYNLLITNVRVRDEFYPFTGNYVKHVQRDLARLKKLGFYDVVKAVRGDERKLLITKIK